MWSGYLFSAKSNQIDFSITLMLRFDVGFVFAQIPVQ